MPWYKFDDEVDIYTWLGKMDLDFKWKYTQNEDANNLQLTLWHLRNVISA